MNDNNYSIKIFSKIAEFLDNDDWKYSLDSEKGLFFFNLSLNSSKINKIDYIIRVKNDGFFVFALCPISVSPDDTEAMYRLSEFFHRINSGAIRGIFTLDFDDGEIRHKIFVDCVNMEPSLEVIRRNIYTPASEYKKYGDGILKLIFTESSPKNVYEKCNIKFFEELMEKCTKMEEDLKKDYGDYDDDDDDDYDDDDDDDDDIFSSFIDDDE